ncbi:MAG: hypothetical protein KKA99_06215 [Gammaproteobacteria bacterium]|nr:hypothetical protein [Gammaproteobacteria bacterium]
MINSYRFGKIVIDGKTYTSDVIVYPDRVDSSWWRKVGHELNICDIEEIVKEAPEVLIVGCGNPGLMKVLEETRDFIESRGIKLISESTEEACKIYNRLYPTKKVVAALHLTC